ncbi:MAG: helix-turn-helix domain-containing protein [Methanothrix sp.]|nr:helix-turn-helix domain-containing protein [Methanothrix sp.]
MTDTLQQGSINAGSETISNQLERRRAPRVGIACSSVYCRAAKSYPSTRARIVLLAAMGKNNREIANELEVSLDTVRLWRQQWLDLQTISLDDLSVEERLDDLPRAGAPPRLTANQICQIQQLACEKPAESGRPISQWTSQEFSSKR